jgi:hypothetical protein
MSQGWLKEMLKPKKAMIESIKCELLQGICPQSALSERLVLRITEPYAAW